MVLAILYNSLLGGLGLLLFTAWSVREYLSVFSFKILLHENIPYWVWSLIMIILFSVVLSISPDSADALKTFTGLDLSNEPAAFIMAGITLGGIAKDMQKSKEKKKNNLNN